MNREEIIQYVYLLDQDQLLELRRLLDELLSQQENRIPFEGPDPEGSEPVK